ncbi:MAG: hypothetical protein M1820_005932 [Bogoriella megaspora]|nr:MAG: hypothetical protein M1820_005932 [Bogoriella megaspora]
MASNPHNLIIPSMKKWKTPPQQTLRTFLQRVREDNKPRKQYLTRAIIQPLYRKAIEDDFPVYDPRKSECLRLLGGPEAEKEWRRIDAAEKCNIRKSQGRVQLQIPVVMHAPNTKQTYRYYADRLRLKNPRVGLDRDAIDNALKSFLERKKVQPTDIDFLMRDSDSYWKDVKEKQSKDE